MRAETRGEWPSVPLPSRLDGGLPGIRAWRSSSSKAARPLSGTVVPAGNKNAALPALAASLLTEEEVVLRNVPRIRDVEAMLELLERLGVKVEWREDNVVALRADDVDDARPSTPSWPSASARRSCSPARCWRASAAPTCRRPAAT